MNIEDESAEEDAGDDAHHDHSAGGNRSGERRELARRPASGIPELPPDGTDVDASELLDLDTSFGLSAFGSEEPGDRITAAPERDIPRRPVPEAAASDGIDAPATRWRAETVAPAAHEAPVHDPLTGSPQRTHPFRPWRTRRSRTQRSRPSWHARRVRDPTTSRPSTDRDAARLPLRPAAAPRDVHTRCIPPRRHSGSSATDGSRCGCCCSRGHVAPAPPVAAAPYLWRADHQLDARRGARHHRRQGSG